MIVIVTRGLRNFSVVGFGDHYFFVVNRVKFNRFHLHGIVHIIISTFSPHMHSLRPYFAFLDRPNHSFGAYTRGWEKGLISAMS